MIRKCLYTLLSIASHCEHGDVEKIELLKADEGKKTDSILMSKRLDKILHRFAGEPNTAENRTGCISIYVLVL